MGRKTYAIVIGTLSLLLVVLAAASLRWRMAHDSPVLMYLAWLISRGWVPYRDFFDMNLPVSYLMNLPPALIGGNLAFRLTDLFYLALVSLFTWRFLRPLGRPAALAPLAFAILYLEAGQMMSMQREFLLLVPLSFSLWMTAAGRPGPMARALLAGLGFGLAVLIKPQAALFAVPVAAFMAAREKGGGADWRPTGRLLMAGIGGFLIPLAVFLLALMVTGALPAFLDIVKNYWPLYGGFSRYLVIISGIGKIRYMVREFLTFGNLGLMAAPAALGLYLALFRSAYDRARRNHALLLAGLAIAAAAYPAVPGQFFYYHWLPLQYALVLLAALCLAPAGEGLGRAERAFPAVILLIALLFYGWPSSRLLRGLPPPDKVKRADEMAAYLKKNLQPGDTVQPLDWTGGALQAMLEAEVPPPTHFIYDFHFYHHVSNPYIQSLRERFAMELQARPPHFILQVTADWPRLTGPDSADTFPELDAFINSRYARGAEGGGYIIWERIPDIHTRLNSL